MTGRNLGRLFLIAACTVGIWIVAGLFSTSEFYRRAIVIGGLPPPINETFYFQMCSMLLWALFTPPVMVLAWKLPLRPPHGIHNAIAVIAFIPLLAVFRAAFGGAVHNVAEGVPIAREMITTSVRIRTHRDIAILAAIFLVANLVDARRQAADRERQHLRAQTLLARAEMEQLRKRLQPQFAVRMLRHIGSVLRNEPRTADNLIVTLSGILRRSMDHAGHARSSLADELEHFDRCLDLCRAGGRFSVDARYVADDDVLACRVPAHALQPVIESVVLDLTSGEGGSVEVRCARDGAETAVDVCWNVTPGGAAMKTALRIPCGEAAA